MKIKIAFLLALFSMTSLAQGPGKGTVIKECRLDIEKFCMDKEHGQGEVRECLLSNKIKVSDKCKEALETTGPKMGGKRKGSNP